MVPDVESNVWVCVLSEGGMASSHMVSADNLGDKLVKPAWLL